MDTRPRRTLGRNLLVVAVAAICALVGAGLVAGATAHPHPRLLVLTARELPDTFSGFERVEAYVDDNARVARDTGGTVAKFEALGRITGYHATFDEKPQRVGGRMLVGAFIHHVESQANLYRSPAFARESFREQISQPLPRGPRVVLPKARVGQEMIALAQTAPNPHLPGSSDNVFFVYWRHGPVTAYVLVMGLKETVSLSDAMALARKQQQRIARALR